VKRGRDRRKRGTGRRMKEKERESHKMVVLVVDCNGVLENVLQCPVV
jgi:hypothetical protein